MFRGNLPAKIEDSGRLKLPVPFKELLDAANVTELYVTSEDGERAQIWPLGEWKKIEEKLARHSAVNEEVKTYLDWTSFYGHQVKIDAQGRIVLQQLLRTDAKLEGDLSVMGRINHLEVVNSSLFKQNLPGRKVTSDTRKVVDLFVAEESDRNGS
jgi:MraZ protein